MAGVKGRSGRRKIPRALRLVDGKRLPEDVPPEETIVRPDPEAPDAPAWLPADARAEWDRLAPELLRLGLLSRLDGFAFASLCYLVSELKWTSRQRSRWSKTETGNPKLAPVHAYRLQVLKQLKSYAAEFGMTPAARDRVEFGGFPLPVGSPGRAPKTKSTKLVTSRLGRPI